MDYLEILQNPEQWHFDEETTMLYYTNSFYPRDHHPVFLAILSQQGFLHQAFTLLSDTSEHILDNVRQDLLRDFFLMDTAILILKFAPFQFDDYLEFFFKHFNPTEDFGFCPFLEHSLCDVNDHNLTSILWNKFKPLLIFLHPQNFSSLENLEILLFSSNYSETLKYFLPYACTTQTLLPEYMPLFKFFPESAHIMVLNLCDDLYMRLLTFMPWDTLEEISPLFCNVFEDDYLCSSAFKRNKTTLLQFCNVDAARKCNPQFFV